MTTIISESRPVAAVVADRVFVVVGYTLNANGRGNPVVVESIGGRVVVLTNDDTYPPVLRYFDSPLQLGAFMGAFHEDPEVAEATADALTSDCWRRPS